MQQLYTCALVDGTGSVLHVARITAAGPVDAARHANFLACSLGGDVAVEMRLAEDDCDTADVNAARRFDA